ncbi:MAG: hypothetical protein NWQ13_08685, partial [Glaciimonas sp.]|nr:hypothetical protein [Glaciimonas sp.]
NKSQPFTSSSTALSDAARAISAILGNPNGDIKSLVIKGQHPLLSLMASARIQAEGITLGTTATSTTLPAAFSAALTRIVANSGLFYESHLLQYAFGRRNLTQMLLEPQAHLGPLAQRFPELFSENPEDETPEWLSARASILAQLSKTQQPQRVLTPAVPVSDVTGAGEGALLEEIVGDASTVKDDQLEQAPTTLTKHSPDSALQLSSHKLLSIYAASDVTNKMAQVQQLIKADQDLHEADTAAEDFSSSSFRER